MTRTERAACELALCLLRDGYSAATAAGVLAWGDAVASDEVCRATHRDPRDTRMHRLLRARLALYLRALLRGTERAWWRVEANGETGWIGGAMPLTLAQRLAARHGGSFRAVRPLWQIAAAHGEREGGA